MKQEVQWKPSRFNARTTVDDGGLMLYNSYTGAIAAFSPEESSRVIELLSGPDDPVPDGDCTLHEDLLEHGFLVSQDTDELRRALYLHQSMHRQDSMHLVLLATEACNFRCNYCYEYFPRGTMKSTVTSGLEKYIASQVSTLNRLTISWHGGEPLLAPQVIERLSQSFIESCDRNGVVYGAEISTNGYFLDREMFDKLLDWRVERFMVTLDGDAEVHNQRRALTGGGDTYQRIVDNLVSLKAVDRPFEINLRVNFDNSNLEAVTEFIPVLKDLFGDDPRFKVYFRPVGCMGGENDLNLSVCDDITKDTKIWEFNEQAIAQGLTVSSFISDILLPTGAVCYAAKPNSLIVDSDGQLYKCSVAIDQENNQLGSINEDGTLDLDLDKMALWTTSGEETDSNCQSCFFRPSCQGNHCPLYRMRTGNRPCSYEKRQIKQTLRTIWLQGKAEEQASNV
ncbi:radical SAM/SPASM domain-containing protein [Paenibacillus wynnii]|uniref:Radical SAM protein n=1 Tax=Paenibacillus wynnii TaxID=268407 RepID=A0A098MG40_9BACL|nr:radical SAM protein [Paenibacillus wynnii]KGE20507.1 radical SAM protein [Paenibacillus wynnii]